MINRVFEIFKEITAIPRGSQNMKPIADFCVRFAEINSLKYIRDDADNIIIFKNASKGKENIAPIILQGHLDMVCQQTPDSNHDFSKNGPEIVIDGDFIKANKTTLGADNGIAVAMIMAILESDNISHPPIEAVLTTDEEIGMLGAMALDTSPLKSKRLINLDSEDDDTITVSCAGGSDFCITLPVEYEDYDGKVFTVRLSGLKGGHSGVEIDKGRVNANILAGRFLNHMLNLSDFRILEINGGDKVNAITNECIIKIVTKKNDLILDANDYLNQVKDEISAREPEFFFELYSENDVFRALSKKLTQNIIFTLLNAPNGIIDMSAEIKGLVETSLNLGILKTNIENITFHFALRSNKSTALSYLEERLLTFTKAVDGESSVFGHYPPWEYKPNSELQEIYTQCFEEHYAFSPKIEAIHAGLECGIFDSKIKGLTSIAVGPQMYDVHTVHERLSISSTEKFFSLLLKVLESLN